MIVSQGTRYISCVNNGTVQQWNFTLKIDGVQQYLYATPPVPIATGTIYHIVGTYDGTTMKLYANGVLVGSLKITTTPGSIDADGSGIEW